MANQLTQGQGERLWATKGVLRLRTPRSWSHFPTSCSWPQGTPKSFERSKCRRILRSAAATVPSSPFSAAQDGRGWIVSPRPFLASFPAGDHALCVHSWKQKLASCHLVKHQGSGLPPAGVSATCKLCQRSPAGAWGLSRRLSRPAWRAALWAPSQLPAAAVASRRAESRSLSSRPRLLQPGPGLFLRGWCKGHPPPPAGK